MINTTRITRYSLTIILTILTFASVFGQTNNTSIYWTFRRKNRKYVDLSQGWGSNSQWSTDLRLDLETNNQFVYNQNGKFDLNHVTPELLDELNQQNLEIQEAIELTKFRHFVNSTKDDSDLFPYDFKYVENKNID